MKRGTFKFWQTGDLLRVKLSGAWQSNTELAYLTEFSEHIHNMVIRGHPWGVLVDMLEWDGSDVRWPEHSPAAGVLLDRRNQICECWLVKDATQAVALEKYILMHGTIAFSRHPDNQAAMNWLKQFKLDTGQLTNSEVSLAPKPAT
ncbi:hypothetical protein P2G88_15600 [Aliiglaciecola sp. CAU 1673]|uniref:hypothetical protein n=1 Tax=Aliiglaciecola sp. CAU 1673 TaxID=3032595 RepID=UPI0023DC2F18|nr:hypothetical protein [Aliiglaciecola sp. CAU 1673]MDF2179675.1 hypothetical protein [Aliiglaciecola sp. CAU 1673]